MRLAFRMLLSLVMVIAVFSIAARAAPFDKADHQSVIAVEIAVPNVVLQSVPPLSTGYDVILNISTTKQIVPVDTSTSMRLGATVDWRGSQVRLQPEPVLRN